jgi:aspartate/methionine/tyrosine aminotransferase
MAEAVGIAGGAHVLIDEVYQDIVASGSHVHLGPNVLVTSSLTKCYGLSGLRCGWVLCAPELARRLRHTRDFMGAVGSVPSDTLAVAAFRQIGKLEERTRAILDPNVAMIHEFLREHEDLLECVVPPRAMKVFPRLKREEDSEPLHDRLRELETSIVPGKFFEFPRHFRLGFAVQPEDVREGLRRLSLSLGPPASRRQVT